MMPTDEELLHDIAVNREGGKFTNAASDRGGATRWGITQATLSAWRGREVDAGEVERLTLEEALSIYRARYLHEPGISKIGDAQLRGLLVDAAILHGPANAVKMLQRAVQVKDDGVFGEVTLAAVRRVDPRKLWLAVFGERMKFIGRIITDNLSDNDRDGIPDNTEYAKGWFNRLAGILGEFVI